MLFSIFFMVKLCQYIHEILGFRKLSEKHMKWGETTEITSFCFQY